MEKKEVKGGKREDDGNTLRGMNKKGRRERGERGSDSGGEKKRE